MGLQDGAKPFGARIALGAEHRLGMIEFAAHPRVLRALSGKHKDDRRLSEWLVTGENTLGIARFERASALSGILTSHDATVNELAPARLQCERGVRQFPRPLGGISVGPDPPLKLRHISPCPSPSLNRF